MGRSKVTTLALAAVVWGLLTPTWAQAPKSKDVMQPVDTSSGSISDDRHLLRVSLEVPMDVTVSNAPAIVVYNRIHALLGIEFGYVKGVNPEALVSLDVMGTGREVMKAFGNAAGVRFEATGPTQMRVLLARSGPIRKAPKEPPPLKKN